MNSSTRCGHEWTRVIYQLCPGLAEKNSRTWTGSNYYKHLVYLCIYRRLETTQDALLLTAMIYGFFDPWKLDLLHISRVSCPNLPCVSMAGRALLAGYPRHISGVSSKNSRDVYINARYSFANAKGVWCISVKHLVLVHSRLTVYETRLTVKFMVYAYYNWWASYCFTVLRWTISLPSILIALELSWHFIIWKTLSQGKGDKRITFKAALKSSRLPLFAMYT